MAAEIPEEVEAVNKKPKPNTPPKWLPLVQLWAKPSDGPVPHFRWWTYQGRLLMEVIAPSPLAHWLTFKKIGFVEGLWEQDVAEFFITDPRTGHYREYNLSPGGAWWAAEFRAPRVRLDPQPEKAAFGVKTKVVWKKEEWIGRISLPQPDLTGVAVNFAAILEGAAGRRFYSLAPLGGDTPDFHRPQEWTTLSLKPQSTLPPADA